jgi:hypothetical protein
LGGLLVAVLFVVALRKLGAPAEKMPAKNLVEEKGR